MVAFDRDQSMILSWIDLMIYVSIFRRGNDNGTVDISSSVREVRRALISYFI
jgi:hypothetical protein